MKNKRRIWTSLAATIGMLTLILDAKTALQGGEEGIRLCIYTIIPSLFPFFVFSFLLNSIISGGKNGFLAPLGKLCGIPRGCEVIMLLGFLGGYPIGAQSIYQTYKDGYLTKKNAQRILGFCNNAGPSFIFGMLSGLFTSPYVPWILWLVHIATALVVGMLLPGKSNENNAVVHTPVPISLPQAMERAIRAIANVCGWVILFRVILTVVNRWTLWISPHTLQITVTGILELANGCHDLYTVPSDGLRFILAAAFLGFGGICVTMQTLSTVKELGIGMYFPGKILQCCLSIVSAIAIQSILFPSDEIASINPGLIYIFLSIFAATLILLYRKKAVAILEKIVYNNVKSVKS